MRKVVITTTEDYMLETKDLDEVELELLNDYRYYNTGACYDNSEEED